MTLTIKNVRLKAILLLILFFFVFLLVLSAPSGCGKSTVAQHLCHSYHDVVRSVSYTTRAPRPLEKEGHDYYFVTEEDFEKKRQCQFFLEYTRVYGNWYGTSHADVKKMIAKNQIVLLNIDAEGFLWIQKQIQDIPILSIFLTPPSKEMLIDRLKQRNESQDFIARRMEEYDHHMKFAKHYAFNVINDDLDLCLKRINTLVNQYRLQCKKITFKSDCAVL